ncbi:MAG: transposase family protein, partial [Chloroflexi bacterium]|nr:transposase family protein [Chloroflexota bacterium]
MRYETIKQLKGPDFKRLTGVQRGTFETMLAVVGKGLREFGRPSKLSRADQLLMTLMYWREYRTEFHIAQSYGVSEAT